MLPWQTEGGEWLQNQELIHVQGSCNQLGKLLLLVVDCKSELLLKVTVMFNSYLGNLISETYPWWPT